MKPNDYFTPLAGQSLLYDGEPEIYRGQCVQSVELWLEATGTTPPIYPSAANYFTRGIPGYSQVSAGEPIKEGDIIVWRSDFPPSGGNGHIDVASADGDVSSFTAWDSNWYPPLKLAHITHNQTGYNSYIAGYLRKDEDMSLQADLDLANYKLSESEKALRAREQQANDMQASIDLLTFKLKGSEDALRSREAQATDLQNQIDALKANPVTPPDSVVVTKDSLWTSFKKFLGL